MFVDEHFETPQSENNASSYFPRSLFQFHPTMVCYTRRYRRLATQPHIIMKTRLSISSSSSSMTCTFDVANSSTIDSIHQLHALLFVSGRHEEEFSNRNACAFPSPQPRPTNPTASGPSYIPALSTSFQFAPSPSAATMLSFCSNYAPCSPLNQDLS